jgi:hypothetical protein
VYISLSLNANKSVLNWNQVCQLHWKPQLHEHSFARDGTSSRPISPRCAWGLYSLIALTQSCTTASSQSVMPSLIFQALGSIPVLANDVGGVAAHWKTQLHKHSFAREGTSSRPISPRLSIWGLYSLPALTQSSTTASSQSVMPSLIFQAHTCAGKWCRRGSSW